jgi:AsmA-like C-terminal region
MQLVHEAEPSPPAPARPAPTRTTFWLPIAGLLFLAILTATLFLLVRKWPFTEQNLIHGLQDKFGGTVAFKDFHRTYFPNPGCIADEVTLRRDSDPGPAPFIYVQKLIIRGSYADLFTAQRRVDQLRAEGLHISVPAAGLRSAFGGGSNAHPPLKIGTLTADGAVLEFARKADETQPLIYKVKQLSMSPINAGRATSFRVNLLNAEPPGEIQAWGQFGPVDMQHPHQTTISGSYKFVHGDLGVFHGIAGILSSEGKFEGPLERMVVEDETDVPDFEVTRSHHPLHLRVKYHAIVNGTNGDVFLEPVIARFLRTTVISNGTVAGPHGKTTSLDMSVTNGRLQDLLRLFVKANRAPMNGLISLRAKATVPPGKELFLEKLHMQGDFGIGGGQFTNPATQANINKLSARSEGEKDVEDPESVVSNVKGHVVLSHAVANFSNLSFNVPGAFVQLHGTYDLISERIDLHGKLSMDVKFSQANTGVKSFFLKALDPLFKKKQNRTGSIVPVKITGIYPHPSYGMDVDWK